MTAHAKTILIPGMTMLIVSTFLGLLALRVVPPIVWVSPRAPVVVPVIWLLFYCGVGAVGAYWSRRVGGGATARFLSGIFAAAQHLWIFLAVVIATRVVPPPGPPEDFSFSALATRFVGFVVLPGIALAIGTLPFLRDGKHRATPLPAVR